ncbi:hypothetical protein V5H42_25620, partial [Salmonella enterica]
INYNHLYYFLVMSIKEGSVVGAAAGAFSDVRKPLLVKLKPWKSALQGKLFKRINYNHLYYFLVMSIKEGSVVGAAAGAFSDVRKP